MIVVIDYGMGNLASVAQGIRATGRECLVTSDHSAMRNASCLVLPGVGSLRDAMLNLEKQGLTHLLNELVLEKKIPIVGFCLGMQLMASRGHEDGITEGFGWIRGEVMPIPAHCGRIPHMGWNDITPATDAAYFSGLPDLNFYFMHSYHFDVENSANIAAITDYGMTIVAAVRSDHIIGTQFHPEKSQLAGKALLTNIFEELCSS
jgi:glutamine amidotransferase